MAATKLPADPVRAGHDPAIDLAKGLATLGVFCIHTPLFDGTWFFDNFIARAVPLFFVLLGLNGELWWRRHGAERSWYASRLPRLLLPFWSAVALWWAIASFTLPAQLTALDWRIVLGALLTFTPQAPIFWFVPVAVQLLLVFPLLRSAMRGRGEVAVLVATAAACIATVAWKLNVLVAVRDWTAFLGAPAPGTMWTYLYPFQLFGPGFLWHVAAGVWIARRLLPVSARQGGVALVVYLIWVFALADPGFREGTGNTLYRLGDPVLVVALLGLAPLALRGFAPAATALSAIGRRSWHLYLGHAALHSALPPGQLQPFSGGPLSARIVYFVVLFVVGWAFAAAAEGLARLRKRS